mgnify:CR=1 FL=1
MVMGNSFCDELKCFSFGFRSGNASRDVRHIGPDTRRAVLKDDGVLHLRDTSICHAGLFENILQRSWWNVYAEFSGYGYRARLGGMVKLSVAPASCLAGTGHAVLHRSAAPSP